MSNNTTIQLQQYKQLHTQLLEMFQSSYVTINIQKDIYDQFLKTFIKFTKSLTKLSYRINEQILNNQCDQVTVNTYQVFSNCLLRMAECSRKIAIKTKNQIFQPLTIFGKNYQHVCQDMLNRLNGGVVLLTRYDSQLKKSRENYLQCAQKLQKYRQTQSRMLLKIQRGDLSQLEKFNGNMKKLTQSINETQKAYINNVTKLNTQWQQSKNVFNSLLVSMEYNEQSRVSFSRRTVQNSIKLLQEFNNAFDSNINQKLEQSNNRMLLQQKKDNIDKKLLNKMAALVETDIKQQFISYQEMCRRRKKSLLEEESKHLMEIFTKVHQNDKNIMINLIKPWFQQKKKNLQIETTENIRNSRNSNGNQSNDIETLEKTQQIHKSKSIKIQQQSQSTLEYHQRKLSQKQLQIDSVKQKILSFQPYSFYFIQILYQKIIEMTSFYCKLEQQNFLLLLNFFITITKNLNLKSQINVELLYKIIQISQRIVKKKQINSGNKGEPIELLCNSFGKGCKVLHQEPVLDEILKYIEKRKGLKKKIVMPQKNIVNQLTKSFFAAVTRKKEPTLPPLTQDQIFNCLQELTNIIANLSLPNQVCLPFLKKKVNNGQSSYDYLKGIVLAKRDQEQRQRLLYKKDAKQQRQQKWKKAIDSKSIPQYCIRLVAEYGFLSKQDFNLKLVCKSLRNIHKQILLHLEMPISAKWPLLIPYRKDLNYIKMKQQVAQNSVPSAIEEIITLDVNRSLHLHGQYFNPTVLHSLLRTYAYYHKDISYCQGMNYLAGYIYIKTLSQQSAYRIFQYLMEKRFKQLFVQQFKNLKFKMFQFERLLSIFHPQLSQHFKRQSISPQCYIVSWIITLFASTYQYTMHSYIVDILWQKFIVFGWRQFYKFVLWLFKIYKDKLLQMTYDKALHFLGQAMRSQLFIASPTQFQKTFGYNIMEDMEKYHITDQLLSGFVKEYELL